MSDEDDPKPVARIHRRIMAYVALAALCLVAAGAYLRELGAANADLLVALVYVFGAVVLGYFSVQIAPEVFKRKPSA